jgi:glycosyltransferase involved in cell wall biosynthesis
MAKFSIVVPAHNEERFLGACLESIRIASRPFPGDVQVIVVLNRCSDRTEEIAHSYGARTVREDARNLAAIRNAGARAAGGNVLVTIDADSVMTPNTLTAIERALATGTTVGGGTVIQPDRVSAGIRATVLLLNLWTLLCGFSGGLFWCARQDFEALGGFDERLVSGEDIDFARRLKRYGERVGRPFSTLRGAHIVTSCRKFDAFGDWCILRHPLLFWRLMRGKHPDAAKRFYYDFHR